MQNECYVNIKNGDMYWQKERAVKHKTIGPLSERMVPMARLRLIQVKLKIKTLDMADRDSVAELVDALSSLLIVMPDKGDENDER